VARLLSRLSPLSLFLLQSLPAFAADEAPVEKASPVVVIGFLVLLVGACVGYGIYLVWAQKQKAQKDD
jgi:hypothetical protein